jgi:hypothetical protein
MIRMFPGIGAGGTLGPDVWKPSPLYAGRREKYLQLRRSIAAPPAVVVLQYRADHVNAQFFSVVTWSCRKPNVRYDDQGTDWIMSG